MRLTLRTLLAYRDGVLNQVDRNVLEAKLRESATARGISLRIDESLKNPKLAPIPFDARDPWFDANQIAEYLDDTTSTELVAEVERRCLENNALLSEVASCHSILSKALNETVEIPDTLKERIKSLLADPQLAQTELRIERTTDNLTTAPGQSAATSTPSKIHPGGNAPAPGEPSSPIQPETPAGAAQAGVAQAGVAQAGVSAGGSIAPEEANSTNRLLHPNSTQSKREDGAKRDDGETRKESKNKVEKLAVATVVEARPEPRGRGIELSDGLGSQVPEYLRGTDRGRLKPILQTACLLVGIVVAGILSVGSLETVGKLLAPSLVAKSDLPKPGAAKEEANSLPKNTNAAESATSKPPTTTSPTPSAAPADIAKTDSSLPQDTDQQTAPAPSQEAPPNRKITGKPTGGLGITWKMPDGTDGKDQLVLISPNEPPAARPREGQSRTWHLATHGQEEYNTTWVFPFAFRNEIITAQGIRALVCGDTELSASIDPTRNIGSGNPTPGEERSQEEILAIPYGQLLLFPAQSSTGNDSLVTRLKLPIGVVEIAFKDSDSICALEIGTRAKSWDWMPDAEAPPSLDAEHLVLEPFVHILGVQGELTCRLVGLSPETESSSDAHRVAVGEVLRFQGKSQAKEAILTMPSWLKSNTDRPIDNLAAKDLLKSLKNSGGPSPDLNVATTLEKLALDRKPEVASMATRLLFQLGDFNFLTGNEGVLEKKGNFAHTPIWLNKITDFLYSPERLTAFEADLTTQSNENSSKILRLIFPMSEAQLEGGGDAFLVACLESKRLEERILAIEQLSQITGTTLNFHAERTSNEAVAEWKKRLEDRSIRYGSSQP